MERHLRIVCHLKEKGPPTWKGFCKKCENHAHDVYRLTLPFLFEGRIEIFILLFVGLICLFLGQSFYDVIHVEIEEELEK